MTFQEDVARMIAQCHEHFGVAVSVRHVTAASTLSASGQRTEVTSDVATTAILDPTRVDAGGFGKVREKTFRVPAAAFTTWQPGLDDRVIIAGVTWYVARVERNAADQAIDLICRDQKQP